MTAPYGVPAPNGQGGWGPPPGPPPGQATFTVPPVPQGGQATVIREPGWSGFPAAAIPPMPPDPRFAQPPAGAPPGPQYQPGQPVSTQHPQPQTQPGQFYQPPQAPAAPQGGIDPSTVLSGPGIPAELQGLTMAQAIAMYGNMRSLAMQLSQRMGNPAPQPPQGPPQQQPGQPPVQGQPGQPPAFDWRNPAAAFGQIIEQALDRRLRPMEENAIITQATNARNVVAQEIGPQRFAQIEANVMQYLHGADPRSLADPELWRVAVRTAIGDATLRGQQPGQPAQSPNGTIPVVRQQGGATPFVPGMPNPAPTLSSFFTETPQAGGQAAQGVTLTPQQMWFADQMGISYADYAAYSQGVPPVNPQQGGHR